MKTSLFPILAFVVLMISSDAKAQKEKESSKESGKDKDKAGAAKGKDEAKEKVPEKKTGDGNDKEKEKEKEREAKTATLKPEDIRGFSEQPEGMQTMLRYALELTGRGLTYKSASADPDLGGTDCSGFVYHVLQRHGHSGTPRQSDEMYQWTWKAGTFRACNGVSLESFEFRELRAGDLLFWVNSTMDGKTDRNPPVTHVMIYLGERASNGRRVCAGASDGRTYDGQRMCGVSVFDFKLPAPESRARFIGYAHLPAMAQKVEIEGPKPKPKPQAAATEKPAGKTQPKRKPQAKSKK